MKKLLNLLCYMDKVKIYFNIKLFLFGLNSYKTLSIKINIWINMKNKSGGIKNMIKEIKSQEEFDKIMHSENADNVTCCPCCGKTYLIDWTDEECKAMVEWSSKKLLIQDALPKRNANEREIMRYAWSGLPMIACSDECLKEQYGING